MFGIFGKKEVSINSVSIPTFGWHLDEDTADIKQYYNPHQTAGLSINFFNLEPDLPTIKDINVLRYYYRHLISEAGGGLVEVNLAKISGLEGVKTIFKIPQQPRGMLYIGSFTVPFKEHSFVIKVQAIEAGTTGMRDSVIMSTFMAEQMEKGTFDPENLTGWRADPYDPDFKEGNLLNISEDEKYDAKFPDHPLSLVRRMMKELEFHTQFKSAAKKLEPFGK